MRRNASIVIATAVAAILANAASATPTAPAQPAATPASSLSNVNLFGTSPSVQKVAPKFAAAVGAPSGGTCGSGQHVDSATGKCVSDPSGYGDNGGLGGHGPGGLIAAFIIAGGALVAITAGNNNNNTPISVK